MALALCATAPAGCDDGAPSRFATSGAKPVASAAPMTAAEPAAKVASGPAAPAGDLLPPHQEMPVVECPALAADVEPPADLDTTLTRLIEAANAQLDAGQAAAAWTCADRAADLAPQSVEAHHLRGAALAMMDRWGDAQLAFGLALSLDPDDPETLRGAAHFYINELERSHDTLRLGLSLAERGSARAIARRRRNPEMIADLALLEAQALSDLGHSDEALTRLEVALRQSPSRAEALHERGVARFNLGQFEEAKADFAAVLEQRPDDAFAHHMLGLTLDWLGEVDAGLHLRRAVELAPDEFALEVPLSVQDLRREIEQVLATLPPPRQAAARAARFEVEDLPSQEDLRSVSPPFPPTILGLYRGPLEPSADGATAPDAIRAATPSIVLYRKNLARAVRSRLELSREIRDTVLHELGHLEGLDEDDLRRRGME
ncbi:MAG: metallopeptidase family protein [Myxococcales bacterium]|nr:metallopeptidase family protein [Myxococcales bacterium]